MKKTLLIIASAIAFAFASNAQPYNNAIGVSFMPDFSGKAHIIEIQWNHFFNEKNNLDIRAGYMLDWGPEIVGMYEWNVPINNSSFRFYGGPGVHFGTTYVSQNDKTFVHFGFTGAAGFEYVFSGAPIAVSIDWRPYLTWNPGVESKPTFGYTGVQFGVKYCF